jgi:hypothetical protein
LLQKTAAAASFSLKKTDPMLFPLAIDPCRIVVKKSGVKKKGSLVKKVDACATSSEETRLEEDCVTTALVQSAEHGGNTHGESLMFQSVEGEKTSPTQSFAGKGTVNIAPKIHEEDGEDGGGQEEREGTSYGEGYAERNGYTLPKSWERAGGAGMESVVELSRSDLMSSARGGPPPGALPSASIIEPRVKGMKYNAWDSASGEIRESGTSTVHKRKNQINFLAQSFQKDEFDEFVKAQLGQGHRQKRGETSRHKYGW